MSLAIVSVSVNQELSWEDILAAHEQWPSTSWADLVEEAEAADSQQPSGGADLVLGAEAAEASSRQQPFPSGADLVKEAGAAEASDSRPAGAYVDLPDFEASYQHLCRQMAGMSISTPASVDTVEDAQVQDVPLPDEAPAPSFAKRAWLSLTAPLKEASPLRKRRFYSWLLEAEVTTAFQRDPSPATVSCCTLPAEPPAAPAITPKRQEVFAGFPRQQKTRVSRKAPAKPASPA